MHCRHCEKKISNIFLDLGYAPPSNSYLKLKELKFSEKTFPLKVLVCENCWLVQTEIHNNAEELFSSDYAYFSSTSSSWLNHASTYVDSITKKLNLNKNNFVIEIASNDGYLLKNFKKKNIPCIGIEPTKSTATESKKYEINVIEEFFNQNLANKLSSNGKFADLIIGNNVYGHVPDINDFTKAMKVVLKIDGTITLEFPHLLNLIDKIQFDTIYHEHFSYLSLYTVVKIFNSFNLKVFDVEQLNTHGGSLRVYGCHDSDKRKIEKSVEKIIKSEIDSNLQQINTYIKYQSLVDKNKSDFLSFLINLKKEGYKVAGYGAAAKANTILNYAGIKPDLLPFICDASNAKQGKYMPGSKIPILHPSKLDEFNPDYIIIFPWNIEKEIISNLNKLVNNKTKFVKIIPYLQVI